MTLSALSKKIEKVENEINKHQEIISDKKKELAELKKQQRTLQLQETEAWREFYFHAGRKTWNGSHRRNAQ